MLTNLVRPFWEWREGLLGCAHAHSPWERGTNENTNGLIRQFFPKGTDFTKVSKQEIKHVQDLLNGRPRKTLGWKTPYEAMQQLLR